MCVNTGFQVRSRAGRWSWTFSPEEIMSREVEMGCESWTSFASSCSSTAVQHCPCDSAQARKLKQQLRSALSHWAMARGHRRNTSVVLAAVHGLSGLFRAVSAVEPSLFRSPPPPPPTPSPSLISHLASVDVKQNGPISIQLHATKAAPQ